MVCTVSDLVTMVERLISDRLTIRILIIAMDSVDMFDVLFYSGTQKPRRLASRKAHDLLPRFMD